MVTQKNLYNPECVLDICAKNEVDPTIGLGGVRGHTHRQTHTQTDTQTTPTRGRIIGILQSYYIMAFKVTGSLPSFAARGEGRCFPRLLPSSF